MQKDLDIQEQKLYSKEVKDLKFSKKINKLEEPQFHKIKLLLSIYRDVVWKIEADIYEVQETSQDYGSDRISELLDFLSLELDEYDLNKDRKAIEDRLMRVAETKRMIEIVDKALKHLKTHPKHGELYHDIIFYCYIDKDALSDDVIMRKLNLTQSTYYRYKKQATERMGVALWGYVISPLKDYWENLQ